LWDIGDTRIRLVDWMGYQLLNMQNETRPLGMPGDKKTYLPKVSSEGTLDLSLVVRIIEFIACVHMLTIGWFVDLRVVYGGSAYFASALHEVPPNSVLTTLPSANKACAYSDNIRQSGRQPHISVHTQQCAPL
jgi:hypothetical protein